MPKVPPPPAPKGNRRAVGCKTNGREKILTAQRVQELIDSMLTWIELEDSIVFNEWLANNGLWYERCCELSKEYPDFAKTLQVSKLKIAARREKMAMQGKLESSIVRATMATYDKEHFNTLKALKESQLAEAASAINIILSGRNASRAKSKGKSKSK